jgi:hypothetical protein
VYNRFNYICFLVPAAMLKMKIRIRTNYQRDDSFLVTMKKSSYRMSRTLIAQLLAFRLTKIPALVSRHQIV